MSQSPSQTLKVPKMHLNSPLVFLSYAKPDRERVIPYYEWLRQSGINAWIDCRSIQPGREWETEISRAVDLALICILFVSENYLGRRGYIQKEFKQIQDRASKFLSGDSFIVPVILDHSTLPSTIDKYQALADADSDCRQRLLDVIREQSGRRGSVGEVVVSNQSTQGSSSLAWEKRQEFEEWDGLPGYRIDIELIRLLPHEAFGDLSEINEFTMASIRDEVHLARECKIEQDSQFHNYGQDYFERTNTFDVRSEGPLIKGKMISIRYVVGSMGARAAHPNFHYRTFAYFLRPLIRIRSFGDLFSHPQRALSEVQVNVRLKLSEILKDGTGEGFVDFDWLDEGTETWDDFANFAFHETGIEIAFSPYTVAAYAAGAHEIMIVYEDIAHLIKPAFRSALGLEYLKHRKK